MNIDDIKSRAFNPSVGKSIKKDLNRFDETIFSNIMEHFANQIDQPPQREKK